MRAFDMRKQLLSAGFAHVLYPTSQASKLLLPLLRSDVGEWNLGSSQRHFEMAESLAESEG